MGSGCNLICCPNCGYQVVDESKSRLVNLLRRVWPWSSQTDDLPQQKERAAEERSLSVPLTHIPIGTAVEVRRLADMPTNRLTRLSAFGLVPGSHVRVLQRRPAHVIRVGETELALSEEILNQIWVSPG